MGTLITDISQVQTADVQQSLSLLVSLLAGQFPAVDLRPAGVLYELMIRPAALFNAMNQENYRRLSAASSLAVVTATPDQVDPGALAALASNYNVVATPGTEATGQISLILSANLVTAIPSSATFTANGVAFNPISAVLGVTTAGDVKTAQDVLITARGNGTFAMLVSVVAATAGSAGNVSMGTPFTPDIPIAGVVTIVAAQDFTGGADTESNDQLVATLKNGITSSTPCGRAGITSMLLTNFPTVTDVSIIGAGDPELVRAVRSSTGIRMPGKADLYVRTNQLPVSRVILKAATLQDAVAGTWSVSFSRSDFPGFYRVKTISQVGVVIAGSLPIISDIRNNDTSPIDGVDFIPDIQGDEGVYSRYQTSAILFTDTSVGSLTAGSTRQYSFTVYGLPQIDTVSDWLLNRSRRQEGSDQLVKAPLPCFVTVGVTLITGPGDPVPVTSTIANAAVNAVNAVDFATGRLSAGDIVAAIKAVLPKRTRVVTPLDLRGSIRFPDGTHSWLFGPDSLVAPNLPDEMCSSRTLAFYLDPADVSVTVRPSSGLPV